MQKIGILLPRSTYYGSISFDLFDGLKQGLKHLCRDDVIVVHDNIGFGTDQQLCYRATEQLLMNDEVSIVFAYVSHRTAQLLKPLFMATNKLLVVLDSGANLPQEWPLSSNTIYHSLHNSLGSWLSAKEASRFGYDKAVMVTGYYDGGYLQTHATHLGFSSQQGRIVNNFVTGYKREEFNFSSLSTWYAEQEGTCFLAPFSGDFVQWYFEEIKKQFSDSSVAIFLPPFGLEESMLAGAPYPNQEVRGVVCWSKHLSLPKNTTFLEVMESAGKRANLFSLLGWEASILADKALGLMEANRFDGRQTCRDLLEFSFEGPRGTVYFDAGTHTSLAPLYRALLKENKEGGCALEVLEEIPADQVLDAYVEMSGVPLENATSGWYNSYVCI